jgi:hypothetical protein
MAVTIAQNAQTTENEVFKPIQVTNTETLVTLSFTLRQLEELAEALTTHETSWSVVPNTPKGRAKIHWSKKDFIVDGNYVFVGGKAKFHYKNSGKAFTFNKHSRIDAVLQRVKEALDLAK